MMSAGLGVGILLPELLKAKKTYATSSSLSKFTESLPIPYPISPPSTLDIAPGTHSFHSSLGSVPTWGYGGYSYLGPTFEVTRGTPVTIQAFNKLGTHPLANSVDTNLHGVEPSDITNPRTVIHLHGSNTEAESDGYPEDTYLPGQSKVYRYNNKQEAGMLWYHDHSVGMTALNLQAGLAGVYLIRDEDDPIGGNGPLGIPAGAPYEVPLILQDQSFNADGSIFFPGRWQHEFYGNVSVVNGKAWPNLNVDRTLYRFRIVNASNSRFYRLKLSSNQPLIQIGSDGGLLNAPVYLSKLLLGPGERADVLIDFSGRLPGEKIVLQNDAAAPYPKGLATVINQGNFPMPEVMQFTVNQGAATPKPIPKRLRVNNPLITKISTRPVRQRNLVLTEVLNPNFQVLAMMLNAVYWHEAANHPELREQVKVDTVEQWNIINLQPFAHTIHLHLVPFQILNRQSINDTAYYAAYGATGPRQVLMENAPGGPTVPYGYPPPDPTPYLKGSPKMPAANEAGWKDTAVANAFEVIRILVPFGAKAAPNLPFDNSFTGRFVWHCHMLNHEDNDMMLPFDVLP